MRKWITTVGSLWVIGDLALRIFDRISFVRTDDCTDEESAWTCEHCGTEIYSTSLEGFVEGLRIHATAIYCPGDDDDDERYYGDD